MFTFVKPFFNKKLLFILFSFALTVLANRILNNVLSVWISAKLTSRKEFVSCDTTRIVLKAKKERERKQMRNMLVSFERKKDIL